MLKIMRQHASNWLIKTILALIIFSFILFFGYSEFRSRDINSQQLLARVEGIPISRQKLMARYEEQMERMKEAFKGEIPENLSGFLQQQLTQQLISEELAVLFAQSLGLQVPDAAVARTIRGIPTFNPQGSFDHNLYQQNRAFYRSRFGEDLEASLRKELMRDRLAALSILCFDPWAKELSKGLEQQGPVKKGKKEKSPEPRETTPPYLLLSKWIEQFRDQAKIELYRNPS